MNTNLLVLKRNWSILFLHKKVSIAALRWYICFNRWTLRHARILQYFQLLSTTKRIYRSVISQLFVCKKLIWMLVIGAFSRTITGFTGCSWSLPRLTSFQKKERKKKQEKKERNIPWSLYEWKSKWYKVILENGC